MPLNYRRHAQSLLEAILAIGVILTATIAATTLIVSTISSGNISKDKISAANLAREGIEVVRGIRDSNWMKRAENIADGSGGSAPLVSWDDTPFTNTGNVSLGNNTGKCYHITYSFPLNVWALVGSSCATYSTVNIVTDNSPSYVTDDFCPTGTGQNCTHTKFKRLITISSPADSIFATDDTTYLRVVSTVKWEDHGEKTYSLTERLYDWR